MNTIEVGGYKIYYDDKDGAPGAKRSPEQMITDDWVVVSQYLSMYEIKPDWTIVHAGAWLGLDTISFAKRCKNVYALEPTPDTYKKLTMNCELNDVHNATLLQMAFSNKNQLETMNIVSASGASGMDINWEANTVMEKISIATTTWDSFTEHYKIKPDLCVIDIEGAEGKFIDGMNNNLPQRLIISTYHPSSPGGSWFHKLYQKGYHDTKKEVRFEAIVHSVVFEL